MTTGRKRPIYLASEEGEVWVGAGGGTNVGLYHYFRCGVNPNRMWINFRPKINSFHFLL